MWLQKLVLATVAVLSMGWECGVTPAWEKELEEQVETARRLQTGTARQRSSTLGPIRIYAHYGDMSALSSTQVTRIKTVLMPSLIAYYANTLSIYPLTQNWLTTLTTCGGQPVPTDHQTPGLANVDLVLYVSATTDATSTFVARAGACLFDGGNSKGSPLAGTFEFNSAHYNNMEVGKEIQVMRHEVAHILAIAGSLFTKYRQSDGTLYTTPVVDSTARGNPVKQLTTPKVVAKAKAAFGCTTLAGLEIENEGGSGTAGSHWEKRIMMNDFMTGSLMTDAIYSDITLAAFEDSGWYTVNYDYTDQITFGKNRGCDFFTTKCVVNGVAQFPDFCSAANTKICGNLNTKKSMCNLSTFTAALPAGYQYFSDTMQGGGDSLADYCPYIQPYSNGDCTGVSSTAPTLNADLFGEEAGSSSRCFTGTYIKSLYTLSGGDPNHTGCHKVTCAGGTASVLIGTATVQCPVAGGQATGITGFDGYINCPPYDKICGQGYCPNGCFGYGKCVSGQCICNDGFSGQDCSIICDLSCKGCTGTGASQCSSCYSNATLASNACTCNSGFLQNSTTKKCDASNACHATCLTCNGPANTQCLTCVTNATFTSGSCPCNLSFARSADSTTCLACDPTCLACLGTTASTCLSCKANAALVNASPSACVCNQGYYLKGDNTCGACDVSCKTCTGSAAAQCLSCYSGSPNGSGQCLCGAGFFMNGSGSCAACSASCASCSTTASACSSCNSAVAVLSSTTCNCLATAFRNATTGACQACHVSCASCSAETASSCLTCGQNATQTGGVCVCNAGYTRNADLTACASCHVSCLTCNGVLAANCLTCKSHAIASGGSCVCDSGFFMNASFICAPCHAMCKTCSGALASQCLSCNPATASVSSAGTCVCSGSNFLSTDGTLCSACHIACLTCTTATVSTCLSCFGQGILTPSSGPGTCSCTDGFYYVAGTGCQRCEASCRQCTGILATQCAACYTGASLTNNQCNCTAGYFLSASASGCVVCAPSCLACKDSATNCTQCDTTVSVLSSNSCQCLSSAFRSSTGACAACSDSCLTCSAASNASCLTCATNAVLSSSPGVCQCAAGFFPNPNEKLCAACHASCRSCSGATSSLCTQCISPATLASNNSCTCPSGYFPNPSVANCQACNSACKTCSSSTANDCLSCFAQAVLTGTAPNSCQCESGTVPLPSVANCGVVNCDATCRSCSASGVTNCSTCYTNAVGQGPAFPTACVCASGFFPSPNAANCSPCDSTCLTCTGTSRFSCLSCASPLVLVDNMYCGSACPAGQTATNGGCQVPTSPLIFRLKLDSPGTPLKDSVAQVVVQSSSTQASAPGPVAFYQQGRLFDGSTTYLQLPPTATDTSRNLVLSATHSVEFWIRPTANAAFGCLISKYTIANQRTSLLLRFCVTDTASLILEFAGVSLSDASSTTIKTLTGGQVSTSRTWTSVGYQVVFSSRTATIASLMIAQKSVKTETYQGVFYKESAGNVNSVQFLVGAGYRSYQVLDSFYKGSIAEVSLYNGQFPVQAGTCSCANCSTGGLCLSQCFSTEYQASAGCSTCSSSCPSGCVRGSDCRANIDPLCAEFSSFTGCTTCGDLAEMAVDGVCRCTANASASSSLGTCSCSTGYQRSGVKCVQCLAYFAASEVSAYFDSSFIQVVIAFTRPVVTSTVSSCEKLFLTSTLMKLGKGYTCSWARDSKTVNINLGTNSTLTNEALALNYVNLFSSLGTCSFTAVPLLPVATYKYPLPKVIIGLTAPQTYSVACSTSPSLTLDASRTQGGKGRDMNFTWTIASEPLLTTLKQYQGYMTNQPVLNIPNALLSTSMLTIGLAVSNYLGTSNSTSVLLSVTGASAISLEIDGGRQITTSAAVKTIVRVNPSSICSKTSSLQYSWTFVQSTPAQTSANFAFLSSPSPPNTLRIPEKTLKPGSTYSFQVKVTDGQNSGSSTFTVAVTRSALVVALDRTDTDISAANSFQISGERSSDPDQSEGVLSYLWSCLEGTSPCTDSSGRQVVNGAYSAVLALQPSQLKAGSTWNVTLTIAKDTRTASKSVILTIKTKTAADLTQKTAVPLRVNPQAQLKLILNAATGLKTTFQWAQTFGNTLSLLTPLTYPYLLIGANTMQSGATYSFSLTATNTDGTASAQIAFTANYPPMGGTATISPTSGIALFTIFQQVCSSWEDQESDYPLSYFLTYTYYNFEVAVGRKQLSNSRLIKGSTGQYQLTAYVYDTLNSYTTVRLPVISITAPQRLLQSTSVMQAFLEDTIDVDRTYEMVRAYSAVYQFDNTTYIGVSSALQTYVSQLLDVDSTDVDSCISALEALFMQKAQMNSQTLTSLLAFIKSVLKRYETELTDTQLAYLISVLGAYPGRSDAELSQIQAFQSQLMDTSTAAALPDQTPAVVTSANSASYARRISRSTLGGMRADAGNTSVTFPSDIGTLLGVDDDTVLDVHTSTQTFSNSTSDEVEISLFSSGKFVAYSFEPSTSTVPVPVNNLTTPIQFSVRLNNPRTNTTYHCAYKTASGQWSTEGVNLTSLVGNIATCQSSHLSTFQVMSISTSPAPTPSSPATPQGTITVPEQSCSTNFAPIAIVSGLVLFGLLFSLVFSILDRKLVGLEPVEARRSGQEIDTRQFKGLEMLGDKPQLSQLNMTEGPMNDSVVVAEPGFCRLFLESHCVTGLFVHSAGLYRWMKTAILAATLAAEMAFIGARYEWENYSGNSHSLQDIWADYDSEDFLYCLSGLGVGLGVGLVLTVLFTVVDKASEGMRKAVKAISALIAVAVMCVAAAGVIYIDLDLCFESGGRWAINFLPTLCGEVLICQTLVAFARAGVLRLLG